MKRLYVALVAVAIITGMVSCQSAVNLTWFGQSTFLMSTDDGVKILMDPVNPSMMKVEIPDIIDLVTVSHEHGDHNYVELAKGDPAIIRGLEGSEFTHIDEEVKGVSIRTVESFHDNQEGAQRGRNAIFIFELQGLNVVHVGDLGHTLDESQVAAIGKTDILMIPVGAGPTLDLPSALEVINQLKPKVVIPMHFMPADAPEGGFRLGSVEEFIEVAGPDFEVKYAGHTETFVKGQLPSKTTIIVLKTSE